MILKTIHMKKIAFFAAVLAIAASCNINNIDIDPGVHRPVSVSSGERTKTPFTISGDLYSVSIKKEGNPDDISLEYRMDGGDWTTYTIGTELKGNKFQFRAADGGNKHFSKDDKNFYYLSSAGNVTISGNIMSLLDGTMQDNTLYDHAFESLFYENNSITDASGLLLPATSLAPYCYENMFRFCQKLTSAPKLPATILADGCYSKMFYFCRKLTSAPALPATTLADNCYENMFSTCEALTSAPALPATTLAKYCYEFMFLYCTGLESAPELLASQLTEGCYSGMFSGCTKLTEAPSLNVTQMAISCYDNMFSWCTGLTSAPELPATTLVKSCYSRMFMGCTGLTEAPYLPADTLVYFCYSQMFNGCTRIKSIRVEFTEWNKNINGYPDTFSWLGKASSTGVFYCPPALDMSARNSDYVPKGWEVCCNPVKNITLDPAEFEILVGETSAAPTIIFDPVYVVNKNVSWSSDNESVAKVDAAGRVTGLAEGTATITAISEDGGKTSQSIVTVIGVSPADLLGTFSVSAGKTVTFSQGNLYWNGNKWRFEDNQYDFPITWDPNHIGHFAWINDEVKAVSGTWDKSWAKERTSLFTNDPVDSQSPNSDFQVYEARGKYRTLSTKEWNYLLNERKVNGGTGEGYTYQNVFDTEIEGRKVFGIFVFPDGFTKQSNWKTVYTTWDAINAAGIVFLPAAGFREGTEMYVNPFIQDLGYYWTSSLNQTPKNPESLYFDTVVEDRKLSFEHNAATDDAQSIRLVADSDPAIGTIYIFDGIVGKYVGNTSDGKKLIVATKNYGSASTTGKGTAYSREELKNLSIPAGWQLPTAQDMAVLAKLGFMDDSANDGAYNSKYDFFIPYTQGVAGGLREGRIWVVGGSDDDFYWFRSDNKSGMTYTPTNKPNYYVRLVKKL